MICICMCYNTHSFELVINPAPVSAECMRKAEWKGWDFDKNLQPSVLPCIVLAVVHSVLNWSVFPG